MSNHMPRIGAPLLALALALVGCGGVPAPPSSPNPLPSRGPLPSVPADALPAISADAIAGHLAALALIAEQNGGVRTAGTSGYDASVEYVAGVLRDLGYEVTTPEVVFESFSELPGGELEVVGGESFEAGPDFHAMIYSAGADITAEIALVGFPDAPGGEGQRGCAADDFDAFPRGAIALVAPGNCFRRDTVRNAVEAGAAAVVVANPQWDEGEARRPTLLSPNGMDIPALSAVGGVGEALHAAASAGEEVRLRVETQIRQHVVRNVIAQTPGEAERVAMLGAHLDSVHDGPGLNDNGSGVSALLEIAHAFAGQDLGGSVRFGFWAAEEFGLYGSRAYVDGLTDADRNALLGYLNLDMLGSANGVPFVYDDAFAPSGSAAISDFLVSALRSAGVSGERRDLGGASDHAPFAEAGIPVGGIFSGATEVKTPEQASLFGGEAGLPLDPCYHLACDTIDNVHSRNVATFASAAAAAARALASGELETR